MARISKLPVERHDGKASLVPEHVIVVRVASFVFRFESVERLRECIVGSGNSEPPIPEILSRFVFSGKVSSGLR